MKKGLLGFTPIEMACIRLSVSFFCSLLLVYKAIQSIPKDKFFTLFIIGIVSIGLPAFLFALSLTKGESAVNGIINALSPLWTVLIGYFAFSVTVSGKKLLGVAIGFMGAAILVAAKPGFNFKVDFLYTLLPIMATLCYGIGTNLTKQKMQTENPLYTTAISVSMVGIPAFIGLLFTNAPAKIATGQVWGPLAAVALLAIFGTFVAWILFYRLLQRTDMLFATSVTYLVPIVAVSWGFLDGEVLSVVQLGGMLLILTGYTLQQDNN